MISVKVLPSYSKDHDDKEQDKLAMKSSTKWNIRPLNNIHGN